MSKALTLKSPAKINLYLKVKSKRLDGFHNIVTLFERVNLCDTLTFKENKSGKIRIKCAHRDVPTGPKNLVYQVARLLRKKYGIKEGVSVVIKKRIPVAAGLAGGSSNAAAAFLALNRLWRLKLNKSDMLRLSRQIGSDVAFFVHQTSWGLGTQRGDYIKPLKIGKKLMHILVIPRVKLYASKVYGALKFKLTQSKDNANILIHHLRNNNINGASSLMVNDLESVIHKLKPGLSKLQQRLKSLDMQGVMISGSGPAVFGLARNQRQANRLKRVLSKRYSQVFVVKTL